MATRRRDPTSWLKSVSAFANTQGGRLLFGVSNDGSLAGLADAQGDSEFHGAVIKADTITKNIDDTISKNHSLSETKTARTPLSTDGNRHVVPNAGNGTDSNPICKTISKESWEILKVISECRHISAEQIGRMLGLSASGVRYHIRALTSKSLIRRVGSAKTSHWEVVKRGVEQA